MKKYYAKHMIVFFLIFLVMNIANCVVNALDSKIVSDIFNTIIFSYVAVKFTNWILDINDICKKIEEDMTNESERKRASKLLQGQESRN
jgi:hypothetical protein